MDVDRVAQSVLAWLRRTKGVVVRTDWLTACVEWIASEEVDHRARLFSSIFNDKLFNFDSIVAGTGCIP